MCIIYSVASVETALKGLCSYSAQKEELCIAFYLENISIYYSRLQILWTRFPRGTCFSFLIFIFNELNHTHSYVKGNLNVNFNSISHFSSNCHISTEYILFISCVSIYVCRWGVYMPVHVCASYRCQRIMPSALLYETPPYFLETTIY